MSNSTVALLAIDKRVTFLATGNDLSRDYIATDFSDYSTDFHIKSIELKDWKPCTEVQKQIFKNKDDLIVHNFGDDLGSESFPNPSHDHDTTKSASGIKSKNVRENFPETWIFESIEMNNSDTYKFTKEIPDSITTWIISAFSMNTEGGFALAKPVELLVTQDFFIKLNLPISMHIGEFIKVQVVIFNYVTKTAITGSLELTSNSVMFDIIDVNANTALSRQSFTAGTICIVSFYVRPKMNGDMVLEFTATAQINGKSYTDTVHRTVSVDPVGSRKTIFFAKNLNLSEKEATHWFNSKCTSTDIAISKDFIKNSMANYTDFKNYT